ncbi:hypothetical protein FACS1894198_3790 [Clostridia bacterium]|nr:hypothetical protein FACS1894198_3790 [Clostridia bacterium]
MPANVQATIGLNDNMSPILKKITAALNIAISDFERLKQTSKSPMDLSNLDIARDSLAQVSVELEEIETNTKNAAVEQEKFKNEVQRTATEADNLSSKISGYVKLFLGFAAAKKSFDWIKESLNLADIQNQAEIQLEVVLSNVGATEGTLESLKKKAAELQKVTMFGDEAMLGGAGELATYISDSKALETMMGTLADYAAGMSGGNEVDTRQMIEYATQLGKVFVGSYDGITRKGFELTEVQKEILNNGTDMEKALTISQVIEESWSDLAESMRNTEAGQIAAMKNAWTNIREEVGNKLYPAVIKLFSCFTSNTPQITNLMSGLSSALSAVINVLSMIPQGCDACFRLFPNRLAVHCTIDLRACSTTHSIQNNNARNQSCNINSNSSHRDIYRCNQPFKCGNGCFTRQYRSSCCYLYVQFRTSSKPDYMDCNSYCWRDSHILRPDCNNKQSNRFCTVCNRDNHGCNLCTCCICLQHCRGYLECCSCTCQFLC